MVVSVRSLGHLEWRGLGHGVCVLNVAQSEQQELHWGLAWPGVL